MTSSRPRHRESDNRSNLGSKLTAKQQEILALLEDGKNHLLRGSTFRAAQALEAKGLVRMLHAGIDGGGYFRRLEAPVVAAKA